MTDRNIIPFDFEGKSIRVASCCGEPWWVLADICKVLEIGNPSDAARRLDAEEKRTLDNVEGAKINGLGANGAMPTVINESGLYSLILTSRKEAAKRFKKWVTAEVLPAIRKTGGYMVAAPDETPEALALRALTVLQATVERQKIQLAEAMPKVEALERIALADGDLTITEAAKALQVRPKDLFAALQKNAWIYKRAGGKSWLGYQAKVQAGLVTHKVTTVSRSDGSEKVVEQVLVTPKGLTRLAEMGGTH